MKYVNFRPVEVDTPEELPNPLPVGVMFFVKSEGQIIVNHGDQVVQYPSFELEIEDFPGATLPIAHGGTGASTVELAKQTLGFLTREDTIAAADRLSQPISVAITGALQGSGELNTGSLNTLNLYSNGSLEETLNKTDVIRAANAATDTNYPTEKAVRAELDKVSGSANYAATAGAAGSLTAPVTLNVQGAVNGVASFQTPGTVTLNVTPGSGVEKTTNKTAIVRDAATATDVQYPSEKAVRVELDKKIEAGGTVAKAGALTGNVAINVTGAATGSVEFSQPGLSTLTLTPTAEVEQTVNKTATVRLAGAAQDTKYPTEKAVRTELDKKADADSVPPVANGLSAPVVINATGAATGSVSFSAPGTVALNLTASSALERIANRVTEIAEADTASDTKYPTEKAVRTALDAVTGGGGGTVVENPNKGVFATDADLIAAYPTGQAGWYAEVLSTSTIWSWQGTAWVDTTQPAGITGGVKSVNGDTGPDVTLSFYTKTESDTRLATVTGRIDSLETAGSEQEDSINDLEDRVSALETAGIGGGVKSVNGDTGPDVTLSFYTKVEHDTIEAALVDRLDGLDDLTSAQAAGIATLQTQVTSLESAGAAEAEDVLAMQGDILDLQSDMAEIFPRVAALETATAALPTMQTSIDTLQTTMTEHQTEYQALQNRMTGIDQKDAQQDTLLEGLRTDLTSVGAIVNDPLKGNAALRTIAESQGSILVAVQDDVYNLQAADTTIQSNIATLQTEMGSANSTLNNKVDKVTGSRLVTEAEAAKLNTVVTPALLVYIYVSTTGNDSTGVAGDQSKPFATLSAALQAALDASAYAKAVTIMLFPGTYTLAASALVDFRSALTIQSLTARKADVIISFTGSLTIRRSSKVTFSYVSLTSPTMTPLNLQGEAEVELVNCTVNVGVSTSPNIYVAVVTEAKLIINLSSIRVISSSIVRGMLNLTGAELALYSVDIGATIGGMRVVDGSVSCAYVFNSTVNSAAIDIHDFQTDANVSIEGRAPFLPMVDATTGLQAFKVVPSNQSPYTLPAGGSWLCLFTEGTGDDTPLIRVYPGGSVMSSGNIGGGSRDCWAIRISN